MKKAGALLVLMAAMLVAVPAYNTALAAAPGQGQAQNDQRGPGYGPGPGYGYHHPGYGPGWQHPAIAPEKQAAFEKIITEHRAKMQPLRNDMWAKQSELEYLSRADNAEAKDISKMVGELKTMREKAQAMRNDTAGKLSKELGISAEHAQALIGRGGPCGAGNWGTGPCGYADGPRGPHHGGKHGGRYMQRM